MKFETKEDVENLIFGIGVDSYSRFKTFWNYRLKMKSSLYWYGLSQAYQNSDNLKEDKVFITLCFSSKEPNKCDLMNESEKEYLNGLPKKIKIYRGMTKEELKSGAFGVSWSLDKKVAEFFAFEYIRNQSTKHLTKIVHEITIDKKEVTAFFNDRKEYEIVFLHQKPQNI
ncbi:hypothetical protein G1L02_05780 [Tenacibaculum finnmarkense]|uniref:hypothetical protein n=1 Tax=Tenacibaculum finnmarkense TaxID=2781243 RepID=UPI00187B5F74|nr:hypothetical protein [Tenacibaculum finnmarkense]MBE7689010.1 hypothetical protein [Tenacibaculum finnmarkense genomovar ulcerans]MCG8882670.1 hypothetical protein [Tenacibaculum finnmarkense]